MWTHLLAEAEDLADDMPLDPFGFRQIKFRLLGSDVDMVSSVARRLGSFLQETERGFLRLALEKSAFSPP